ncbi:MAG TPA: hypothetical protein VD902_04070, partial [Symbiobacteriaceae bacterium]|nr:hypothetical protein [Symbiobacteriaceae bacterium]
MMRTTNRTLAALLAAAILTMPSAAMADKPQDLPVPISEPTNMAGEAPARDPVLLAEAKVTREQAIAIITAVFTIPADMAEPNVSLSQSKEGAVWHVN